MTPESRWTLLIVGYFALQVVLRASIGRSLQFDEAEALYFARHLAMGYGPQPPLYFWLQWGLFQVLGAGLPALALLKNAILGGTFVLIFRYLCRAVPASQAGVATLALGLLPSISWEAQRTLTHSVLAFLLAAAALGLWARALERGRWSDHLAFGLVAGLGLMAKLNFLIWVSGLVVAALLLPEWRLRVRPLKVGAAAAVTALVAAPVATWIALNPALSMSSVYKFGIGTVTGPAARLAATLALGAALIGVAALIAVVLGTAWLLGRRPAGDRPASALPPEVRLMGTASALSLLLLWVGFLVSGSTWIAERWLLPFAWGVVPPIVLALWPRLTTRAHRGVAGMAAAMWLVAMVGLPLTTVLDAKQRGVDHGPLAARLAALGAPGRAVVVTNEALAGNLVYVAPELEPELLLPGVTRIPPGPAILLADPGDPLLERPDVARRAGATETFDLPGRSGGDRVIIAPLDAEQPAG